MPGSPAQPAAPASNLATGEAAAPRVEIRQMNATDLKNGLLETLSALGDVGLSYEEAVAVFQRRLRDKVLTYVMLVDGRVVGTASLVLEQKFLHQGGFVGHLEDVAIRKDLQNRGIGAALIKTLLAESQRLGCYKVVLQCVPDRMPFYERAGFREWTKSMRIDFNSN